MDNQGRLRSAFKVWKETAGISDNARLVFLFKNIDEESGYEEKGEITDYFFITQDKIESDKNIVFMRILNTPENRQLLADSNCITLKDFNPLHNDFVFAINQQFTIQASVILIEQQISPTGDKYPS